MKNRYSINYLIIVLGTLLLAWLLPKSYHLVTDTASKNIFTYYSSVDKAFCTIDFDDKEERLIRKNMNTNRVYSESEFDSILPMFYSRQLMADGRMPKSIDGKVINLNDVKFKKFFFKITPADKNKPHIPLYTLFESMSGRVRIEMPGDVFRLNSKIEFINPETNRVNEEKSQCFNKIFEKRGFRFPAKMAAGNPSTRKAYDEGYFIIDNDDQIFHLKMVNAMPFLRKVSLPAGVVPEYILTMEPDDRSFYAFVFDTNKRLYIITTDAYKLQEIPTSAFDINKDQLLIMANPLFWNINVISSKGKTVLALNADTKQVVDEVTFKQDISESAYSKFILPFAVGFTNANTKYIKPMVYFGSYWVLLTNLLLTLVFVFITRYRKQKIQLFSVVWIAITGIYGFIANIIFNR
ncbi:hypothetical protein BZG01_03865 [Labilibaculum manganireducens]|uniref:DUF4857 domain-containing protein n=1 Tax=Labilibaculum manganireducens TaxID=1940525 RepID=A0A2N3IDC3_9BACT|nr:DUF4857 domain-containing protein [Labilibaculum manganireducens]PKQ68364.1 hypothetical protein BZG01_03865 [Labilibaculum manganireducens]